MKDSTSRVDWKWPALGVLFLWAYLPTMQYLIEKWAKDPQYSHGPLVPLFAGYLIYLAWDRRPTKTTPLPGLGVGCLIAALACRIVSGAITFEWLDGFSMLLSLAGLVLTIGGIPLLRWAGPAIGFLIFMIPLPHSVEVMLGQQLQRVATLASTFLLQTLGQPAIMEGNTILIHEVRLGVVEACSGLRMLMTFVAFSVAAILLIERTKLEKGIILFSAVPIALATNALRITGTGLAHVWTESHPGVIGFIHDFNGWLMMPIGLCFLGIELWILKGLIQPPMMPTRPIR